ncbi:MAG: ASPIC/UnbV domain-containing protein, partial [Candidatus Marinimicrobia bacterium]|nr:ASPIC/UnbV domain-containing protein [Candidatus Neomarinimicrobiota bacterium]
QGGWPPPATPANLVANPGDVQVTLRWRAITEPELSHYVVYQSTTPGFTPTSSDSVARVDQPDSTVTLTDLFNGTTYFYRLAAVNTAGLASEYSNEAVVTPVATLAGNALQFDGINDYVQLPTADVLALPDADFTVEAWIMVTSFDGGDETVVGTDENIVNEALHLVIRNQRPYLGFGSNDLTGNTLLSASTWYHIVWRYTKSSGEQAIFVDGVLDNSGTGHAAFQGTGIVRIGRWLGGNYFNGHIDEVRVWSLARTQTEIQRGMGSRLGGNEPGLVGYWRLDESSGTTTAYDGTPNGNHGTVFGAQFVASAAPLGITTFNQVTLGPVVTDGGDSRGSSWGDYDNDGDLDLFVANWSNQNNFLYANNGDGSFSPVTTGPVVSDGGTSLGSAWGDYDDDGDLDLFVANSSNRNNFLYANNGNSNSWINLKLVGTQSNVSAIGAKVWVKASISGPASGGVWQLNEISGQTGHGGQNSLNAEFGLGDAASIDSLKIAWPSGIVQVLTNVAVDQFLTIEELVIVTHTEIVTGVGQVSFTGTGLTMNFTSQSGTDTIVVSQVQKSPGGDLPPSTGLLVPLYWVIDHSGTGIFSVDMTFNLGAAAISSTDQATPGNLTLLSRATESGDPWAEAASGSSASDSSVTFAGITGFSEFTIGTFADIAGPTIASITATPSSPSVGQAVTVTATVTDISGVGSVTLMYLKGGASSYNPVSMADQGLDTYAGTIPASAISLTGLAYFVLSEDNLGNPGTSDTVSIPVRFIEGALSTSITGSTFPNGFPKDKWRLISLPGDPDVKSAAETIGDDLGALTSNSTWKLFRYTGTGYAAASGFVAGESYWLKQIVADNVAFRVGPGETADLTGFSRTLQPRRWYFIASPYAFEVPVSLDPAIFYGPFTYGPFGTGGQEGWSVPQPETSLRPWGGYILYNNTDQVQDLIISPAMLSKVLAKGARGPLEGWQLQFTAEGRNYFDRGNSLGRVRGAQEGLDGFDHPEPPYVEGYVSLAMERPEWGSDLPRFTSDMRSLDETNGTWELALYTKDESGGITLSYDIEGDLPITTGIVLVDLMTREVHDLVNEQAPVVVTAYSERFPYRLVVVAGTADYLLAKVHQILAALPEDFALSQNYPNPFNPVTRLRYALPRPARVSLRVYNLLGQEVVTLVDDWQDMGYHEVSWNSRNRAGALAASGLYIAVLAVPDRVLTRKMVLLK